MAFTFQPSVMEGHKSLPTASLSVLYGKICHKGIVTVTRKKRNKLTFYMMSTDALVEFYNLPQMFKECLNELAILVVSGFLLLFF